MKKRRRHIYIVQSHEGNHLAFSSKSKMFDLVKSIREVNVKYIKIFKVTDNIVCAQWDITKEIFDKVFYNAK